MKNIIKNTLLAFLLVSPEVMAINYSYCEQLKNPTEIEECTVNRASPEVVRLLVSTRALRDSTIELEKAVDRLQ